MTEQEKVIEGLLKRIEWAVEKDRTREEIAGIVSAFQAYLEREQDKETSELIWDNFSKLLPKQ